MLQLFCILQIRQLLSKSKNSHLGHTTNFLMMFPKWELNICVATCKGVIIITQINNFEIWKKWTYLLADTWSS